MKKSLASKIALNLALLQLFSSSIALVKTNERLKPKASKKFISVENDIKYRRLDTDTGEYKDISIFDYDNISSHQYGASQMDFKNHFETLIEDPLIWEEMQKYYPVELFEDEEEALFFYKKYFEVIADNGCGYASAANYVFRIFEGREEDFYNTFGYSMYTVKNNILDFNYELFMLKFFNYSVLEQRKEKKIIEKAIEKDFYEFKLYHYIEKNRSQRKLSSKDVRNWTDEEWEEYRKKDKEIENHIKKLSDKYNNAKTIDYYFGIETNASYGYLYLYLRNYGVKINASIKNGLGKPKEDEIIASDDFALYKTDGYGHISKEEYVDNEHYIYVTEIDNNGSIYVSSWGEMYLFDSTGSKGTHKVILQLKK